MLTCFVGSGTRRDSLRDAGEIDAKVSLRRSCDAVEGVVRVAGFRPGDVRLLLVLEGSASEMMALGRRIVAVAAGGLVDGGRSADAA